METQSPVKGLTVEELAVAEKVLKYLSLHPEEGIDTPQIKSITAACNRWVRTRYLAHRRRLLAEI